MKATHEEGKEQEYGKYFQGTVISFLLGYR
jgi:hypothetical protein